MLFRNQFFATHLRAVLGTLSFAFPVVQRPFSVQELSIWTRNCHEALSQSLLDSQFEFQDLGSPAHGSLQSIEAWCQNLLSACVLLQPAMNAYETYTLRFCPVRLRFEKKKTCKWV